MSAPDTNVERQAQKHKAPLMGIGGAMAFAILAAMAVALFLFTYDGDSADVNPVEPAAAEGAATDAAPEAAAGAEPPAN